MAKKKVIVEETWDEEKALEQGRTPVAKASILPLATDFGREDLNNVACKINEIIEHING